MMVFVKIVMQIVSEVDVFKATMMGSAGVVEVVEDVVVVEALVVKISIPMAHQSM